MREKEDKKPLEFTSFTELDGMLYEQILKDEQVYFLCFNPTNNEINEVPVIQTEYMDYQPIIGQELETGSIVLPTGISEYGKTSDLLDEITSFLAKWLDIPSDYRRFASYYVLLTWVFDRLNTLPYLRALGDTGTGKSRFLDVIGGICYKAFFASGCITPAPIYRMIRKWNCTLILDEADFKNSDEYNEITTLLNCGFERNRAVIRCVKDKPSEVETLPVFSPKVFATRRKFKDVALEARCLTNVMQETSRNDISPVLTDDFYKEQAELRNKLLLWRFHNYNKINAKSALIDLGDIEPRLKQIGSAFGAVFAASPEVLADFKIFMQEHQTELIEQRGNTVPGQVVNALFELSGYPDTLDTFDTVDTEKLLDISAGDISEKLELDLKPQTIGLILKGLGIKTKLKKVTDSTKRLIIFDEMLFNTLRRRYISSEVSTESSVSSTMVHPKTETQSKTIPEGAF